MDRCGRLRFGMLVLALLPAGLGAVALTPSPACVYTGAVLTGAANGLSAGVVRCASAEAIASTNA